MKYLKRNKIILIMIIIIFFTGLYFIVENVIENYQNNEDMIFNQEYTNNIENDYIDKSIDEYDKNDINNSVEKSDIKSQVVEEKIYVYITGEVNNAGVLTLEKGSRIIDAINAAGGTTDRANISKINLVYLLSDGMKINIPNNEDLKNNPDFPYITLGSEDGRNEDNKNQDNQEIKSTNTVNSNIININTATQTELETLPGIGPSLALQIINYRNENGKFSNIEDIKNVSGIGESKFNNIKKYITI